MTIANSMQDAVIQKANPSSPAARHTHESKPHVMRATKEKTSSFSREQTP